MKLKINERDIYLSIMASGYLSTIANYNMPIVSWIVDPYQFNHQMDGRKNLFYEASTNVFDPDPALRTPNPDSAELLARTALCGISQTDEDLSYSSTFVSNTDISLNLSKTAVATSSRMSVSMADFLASMKGVGYIDDSVTKGTKFAVSIPYPVVAMQNGKKDSSDFGHAFVEPRSMFTGLGGYMLKKRGEERDLGYAMMGSSYSDRTYKNTADTEPYPMPYSNTALYGATLKPGPEKKWKNGGGFKTDIQTSKENTSKELKATVDRCLTRNGYGPGATLGLGRSWFDTEEEELLAISSVGSVDTMFDIAVQESVSVLFMNIDHMVTTLVLLSQTMGDVTTRSGDHTIREILTKKIGDAANPISNKELLIAEPTSLDMLQCVQLEIPAPVAISERDSKSNSVILKGDSLHLKNPEWIVDRYRSGTGTGNLGTIRNAFDNSDSGVAPIARGNNYQSGLTRWNGDFAIHTYPVRYGTSVAGVQGAYLPSYLSGSVSLRTIDGSVGVTRNISTFRKMSYFLRGHALRARLPAVVIQCEDGWCGASAALRGALKSYKLGEDPGGLFQSPIRVIRGSNRPTFVAVTGGKSETNYRGGRQ